MTEQEMRELDAEEWRPIAGFDGYEVSSLGRVRSYRKRGATRRKTPRILSLGYSAGYAKVSLSSGTTEESRRDVRVHVLVLEAFVRPRPIGHVACHANGDKLDNRVHNLRWDTQSGNERDKIAHGRGFRGERNYAARFSEDQIREIRTRLDRGELQKNIAADFGVHYSTISRIKCRRNWSWLS